jgi:hypothetical protein
MSLGTLLTELESLERKDRCQVIGRLLLLNVMEDDPQHPQRTAAMLEDPQPWVPWEEAVRKLDEADARDE